MLYSVPSGAGRPAGTTPPPAEPTSYIGRTQEGAEIRRLLGRSRLVTLAGPGGVGKTRLAARVMQDSVRAFEHAAVFVELAPVRDGALVANLAADRLGLQDRSDASATRTVIEHLRNQACLLVLDNCEHVIDACAGFVATILAECPRVVVLATSRQSLAVAGERLVPVQPLPTADAVLLFLDRAASIWPDAVDGEASQDELTELCRRLDGLPLAIELAAARIRSLSPAQILERLTGQLTLLTTGPRLAPLRQQTLRATIDWSHELCSPAERTVWRRASVFAGSFDLDAAVQVCGDGDIASDAVLDLIDSLLDKSVLVRRDEHGAVRYQMLEVLREYGHEQLTKCGEQDETARRHRDWYSGLVTLADEEWLSRHLYWIERLTQEHANLRAALDWSLTRDQEVGVALVMASRPFEYWLLRGLSSEERMWLDRALAAAASDDPERPFALCVAALHALWQGDQENLDRLLDEVERLAAAGTDEELTARILHVRAFAAMMAAKPESVDLAAEACAIFQAHGLVRAELHPLFIHGVSVAYRDRDLATARRLLSRMNAVTAEHGATFYQAMSLFGLAIVEVEFGDTSAAAEAAAEALRLDVLAGDLHGRAYRIDTLAWIATRQGEHTRAATLFGIAATVWDRIGTSPDFAVAVPHRRHLKQARQELGDARFDEAFTAGRALPAEEGLRYALHEHVPEPAPTAGKPSGPLSPRETEIAGLIAQGLTNRDIATKLVISPRTAETHVQHIMTKLGFHSRAQIAVWLVSNDGTA